MLYNILKSLESLRSLFSPGIVKSCYVKLSSIRTSVYLLGLLVFLYVIGTVFPQGEEIDEYIKAGGRFVIIVKAFKLLDFFSSPLFLLVAFIFFLNLVICSYERYIALFSLSGEKFAVKDFKPTHTIYLTQAPDQAPIDARKILTEELGFRILPGGDPCTATERGLPYRWFTWIYHAGIILLFIGFTLTYLFAFEDKLTLKPGKPAVIEPHAVGRIPGLWKSKQSPSDFNLLLDEFTSDYNQSPRLSMPKDKLSRLAIGLGWQTPAYELKDDSVSIRDWKSRVRVIKKGSTLYEKEIKVNEPLRFGGYTFYQEGFEQILKIKVNNNPVLLETKTDDDLLVPGSDTPIKFKSIKSGKVYKLDGTVEKLKPFTTANRVIKDTGKNDDLGKLELGGSIEVDGRQLSLVDFEESSVLSLRYDPGYRLLWWAGMIVLISMAIRFYWPYYRVTYRIGESRGIAYIDIDIFTRGHFADAQRLMKRLEYYLTLNDKKPFSLPSL